MRFLAVAAAVAVLCGAWTEGSPPIDHAKVQRAVDAAMAGRQGAVVVLDAQSGQLVASHRLDSAARRLARPGSVVKPFTLMALLSADIVKPDSTVMCMRTTRVAGRNLDCSHVHVDEPIDAVAALAYSCNYFFTRMADRLDGGALVRAFEQAGLASRTGLAANEATGIVRRPATREALQLMAVGEDSVEVTPLGVAAAYRRLASRARAGDKSVRLIVDGMQDATRYGTARLAKPRDLAVAGKTGTATAASGAATHAWFAGFAPADRPEIVVVVFLEQGSGGGDAAPIAGSILEAYR
jgi:penicillin-binding protein 2